MQDRRWLSGVSRCFKPAAWREIRSQEILPQMRIRDHGINRYVAIAKLNTFNSFSELAIPKSDFYLPKKLITNVLKMKTYSACFN